MEGSDDEILLDTLFPTVESYNPPPAEAHFTSYVIPSTKNELKIRLVGHSPLWGHLLWNAGIYTANYLDKHQNSMCKGKRLLELGAAAGLPSLVAGMSGGEVVITDYPDPELIENLEWNVNKINEENRKEGLSELNVTVKGYIWGNDVNELVGDKGKFDTIILSDLVFNHTEHHKLLKTCRDTLKRDGRCFVVFSPHRPKLLNNDLEFFTTCEEYGFKAEKNELVNWKPMFEEEEETAEIRARVYSYFLIPQW